MAQLPKYRRSGEGTYWPPKLLGFLHNRCYVTRTRRFETTKARALPKIVDPEEKRAALVAASWSVIAQEGLGAATLRRVASVAGVTTGALTHYFSDRDALLIEALRAAHLAAGARMLRAAERDQSPKDRLTAVVFEALPLDHNRLTEWKVWLAFWGAATGDARLLEQHRRRYAEWRKLLRALLAPLEKEPRQSSELADHLMVFIDGLGIRVTLAEPARFPSERARAVTMVTAHIASLLA